MSATQESIIMPIAFSVGNSDTLYYNTDELKKFSPQYFKGTSKSMRAIITRQKIPIDAFIYGLFSNKDNVWCITIESVKKAKVLIKKEWIDANMFKKSSEGEDIMELNVDYAFAPEIIQLNDDEKFKDNDGIIMDIETRGEKNIDGILFDVKDVSIKFNAVNIIKYITDKDGDYTFNIHYKMFFVRHHGSLSSKIPDKSRTNVKYFFTYWGIVKFLFSSRNANAEGFQRWVISKLFAHQMGSIEDKIEVIADSLKVSTKKATTMYKRMCADDISCIYLMEMGTASQLRTPFGIPASVHDNEIIYKYGHTDDLLRRMGEHKNDYGKILKKEIFMEVFAHIEESKTSEAENELRQMLSVMNMVIDVEGRKELVAIPPEKLKMTRKIISDIGNKFSGKSDKLKSDIATLNSTIVNMFQEEKFTKLQIDGLYKEITNLTKEIVNLEEKNETLKVTMSAVLKCETDYLKSELKSVSKESELTLRVKDMEIEKLKLAMKIK
jgi:hypothetical protein